MAQTGGDSTAVRWLGRVPSLVLGCVACAALAAMMLLTVVDVIGRYLFASPLPAAYEMIAFTMPVLIFCALPTVCFKQGHVTIDLLDKLIPTGLRRLQHVVVHLVAAAAMAFIAWRLAARAFDHYRFEGVTDELYLPLWPFSAAMAALSAVAALTLLAAQPKAQGLSEALIGLAVLLGLSFLRLPIAFSMAVVGFFGMSAVIGYGGAMANVGQTAFDAAINYELSVVPLFVLMGNLVARARLAEELYAASNAFLGHRRGGLAMATVVACGGFSAICGSSLATAATMAKVAIPSMRRFGYRDSLATGAIAAGGTLGILIPPSVLLVIYGILTQTSIGKLFAAGILPGLVAIGFYLLAVRLVVTINPAAGPAGERQNWHRRGRALARVWGVLLLFAVVMGGIYGGVFSPTEAAGIGAFGAFLFALARRALSWRVFYHILLESAATTAMLFTVLIGALLFANFINLTDFPNALLTIAGRFADTPALVIAAMLVIYVLLGCVFESLSMILLTVPIFFPLVVSLGYDPIWFGIVVVVITEISLITPPVGLNVFVLRGVLPDVSTTTVFKGVTPFWIADLFRLAVIVGFPALSLWLPSLVR